MTTVHSTTATQKTVDNPSMKDWQKRFIRLFGAILRVLLERGVLIRIVDPEGYLRISIGTPDEMEAFRSALDGVLAGTRPRAPRAAAERP